MPRELQISPQQLADALQYLHHLHELVLSIEVNGAYLLSLHNATFYFWCVCMRMVTSAAAS